MIHEHHFNLPTPRQPTQYKTPPNRQLHPAEIPTNTLHGSQHSTKQGNTAPTSTQGSYSQLTSQPGRRSGKTRTAKIDPLTEPLHHLKHFITAPPRRKNCPWEDYFYHCCFREETEEETV
ncbi:hypothetical protein ACOSQ2_031473 [Xanthoceras sorbifolium]